MINENVMGVNFSRSVETLCKSSRRVNGPYFHEEREAESPSGCVKKLQLFEFIDRAFCQALKT